MFTSPKFIRGANTQSTSPFPALGSDAKEPSQLFTTRAQQFRSSFEPCGLRSNQNSSFLTRSLPRDQAGSTLDTARKVAFKSKQLTLKDFVGTGDQYDYYRLDFSQKAPTNLLKLSFSSKETISSFGLSLLDKNGNYLQAVGSKLSRTVISAESYYLRVQPALLGGGDYTLKLSADPILDKAGNTAKDARSLSVKSKPTVLDDFVGRGDRTDYYKIAVNETTSFNLNVAGRNGQVLEGGVNLYLRDSNLSVVKQLFSSSGGVSLTNQQLAPGTYYIQMEPFSSTLDSYYRMTLSSAS